MHRFVCGNLLETAILPQAEESMPMVFKFQYDNDPKHSFNLVKAHFRDHVLDVHEQRSQSPDLNIIEKAWGELTGQVSKLCGKMFRKYSRNSA